MNIFLYFISFLFSLLFFDKNIVNREYKDYNISSDTLLFPKAKHTEQSKFIYQLLSKYHYKKVDVDDSLSMKILKNLGYMEVIDSGASGAANFVLGFSRKDVAITYKERVDKGIYAVSVRGSPSCKTHLAKLVSSISAELGGSGGGHDIACGAVIPKDKIIQFVRQMNLHLNNK